MLGDFGAGHLDFAFKIAPLLLVGGQASLMCLVLLKMRAQLGFDLLQLHRNRAQAGFQSGELAVNLLKFLYGLKLGMQKRLLAQRRRALKKASRRWITLDCIVSQHRPAFNYPSLARAASANP